MTTTLAPQILTNIHNAPMIKLVNLHDQFADQFGPFPEAMVAAIDAELISR